MFERLKAWLFGRQGATKSEAADARSTGAAGQTVHDDGSGFVPYDENLLERRRTQWQFGDWASLAKLERHTLQPCKSTGQSLTLTC